MRKLRFNLIFIVLQLSEMHGAGKVKLYKSCFQEYFLISDLRKNQLQSGKKIPRYIGQKNNFTNFLQIWALYSM